MSKFKYFPRIEEFDAATNQVRLKDADGIVWVAPLPWFGVIRELSLNTPCVLIQWDDVAHSSDGFPDDQRVIFVLKVYEYQSYEQIAAMLKIPHGTVMSRLSRARQKLKNNMAEYLQGGSR